MSFCGFLDTSGPREFHGFPRPAIRTAASACDGGSRLRSAARHARRDRAFLQASVSPLLFEYFTVGTTRIPGSKVYGPGFQGGYQYVARSGLTGLASVGTGFPIGAEMGDRVP